MALIVYNSNSRYKNPERLSITGSDFDSVYVCRKYAKKATPEGALFLEISCFEDEIELTIVCALCCLIESFHSYKCLIKIEMDDEIGPFQFLKRIGFFDQWNEHREWHIKSLLNTSFGIIRYDPLRLDAVVAMFSLFFSQHDETRDKDVNISRLVIAEALNNISDHSTTKIGFATIQLYPRREELEFVVCDFGVGIPQALFVNPNLKVKSHLEVLKMSLERGVSSGKNPHNKGMGLNIISQYANFEGCSFELLSGGASIKIDSGTLIGTDLAHYPFSGTLMKLRLKTAILGVVDDDETGGIDI